MSFPSSYQNQTPQQNLPAVRNSQNMNGNPYQNPQYGNPYGNAPYGAPGAYQPMPCGQQPYPANRNAVPQGAYAQSYGGPMTVVSTLVGKWRTSATIWTIIGVFQIIGGLFTILMAIGIAPLALGIWNIVQANKMRTAANQFSSNPAGILRYADSSNNGVLELIINFIFGAFFGIIGAIYDISTENYAKAHRQELWAAEQMAMGRPMY